MSSLAVQYPYSQQEILTSDRSQHGDSDVGPMTDDTSEEGHPRMEDTSWNMDPRACGIKVHGPTGAQQQARSVADLASG